MKNSKVSVYHVLGNLNRGGAETFVVNLNRTNTNYIFNYIIFSENKDSYYDEVTKLGAEVYQLPVIKIKNFFTIIMKINNIYKDMPLGSIIHVHHRTCSRLFSFFSKVYNQKMVLHAHSDSNEKNIKGHVTSLIQSNGRSYDARVSCTHKAGEWMFKGNSFEVINNAVEIEKYNYCISNRNTIRKKMSINEEVFLIGHVGNKVKAKNHEFLIDLATELEHIQRVKFVFIGRNICSLANIEKVKSLQNIILIDSVDDIEKYYSAMDLFVLPSIREGLPLVLVEAQANGLNCLVSKNVSPESKVTGKIQFLDLNLFDWKNKIIELINTGCNHELNEKDLNNLEKFEISYTWRLLDKMYMEVLSRSTKK